MPPPPSSAGSEAERRQAWALAIVLVALAVGYVAFALTPSHYAFVLKNLFEVDANPLLGQARGIRSDELAVLTPLFQTAVLGDFATTNQISPYGETLKGFWALPIEDWSLVFKPQLWGFWILPPAYAYSLYFASMWVGFLVGYTLFMRQLGAELLFAAAVSVCLFSSHFVQVWWSSNAPAFALAPWPAVVFMANIRFLPKIVLGTYAACVWAFSLVYPPFMISGAFAFLVLILAFRPQTLSLKNLAAGVLILVMLGAVFVAYYGELIGIMRETAYPGQRVVSTGNLPVLQFLAHIFPFLNIANFATLIGLNDCEVAVVATLIPLSALVFVRKEAWRQALAIHRRAICIWLAALIVAGAWMLCPVPASWGKPLLWHYVPDNRMLWGFGVLFTLGLARLVASLEVTVTQRRIDVFIVLLTLVWLVSKISYSYLVPTVGLPPADLLIVSWRELVPVGVFCAFAIAIKLWPPIRAYPGQSVMAACALSGVLTFNMFNPLQSAHAIFTNHQSERLTEIRATLNANPNGWLAMDGYFGAIFSGVGIPAINHVLVQPQLDIFARYFPDMDPDDFNTVFNRYAYIGLVEGLEQPELNQSDSINLPLEFFLRDHSATN